ncbi:hypothetical protein OF83DRAFT_1096648 [Amylostereum chailletii]|nr:hypothetical protein OF83DRAFT_1096648 [Amylostereum chailletii]
MTALRGAGIPFIRRRSGGGTVYHDLGNTNFSIHLPRTSFDRHATAQVVLRAVRSLNIDANVNDRSDICVGSHKVSGSAYKIVMNRAYHHGTMLISTQLDTLGEVLHVKKDGMKTKGVASVRSPVKNLAEYRPQVSHHAFMNAMVQAFREEYDVDEPVHEVNDDPATVKNNGIDSGMKQLTSWEWAYGQTPEFQHALSKHFPWGEVRAMIYSKHGKILSCTVTHADPLIDQALQQFGQVLKDHQYGSIEVCQPNEDGPTADVWLWLSEEMKT